MGCRTNPGRDARGPSGMIGWRTSSGGRSIRPARRHPLVDPPDGWESSLSQTTIRRIWNAFGLQLQRSGTFRPSGDPDFTDRVRDIVGPYLSPPDRAVVLRVDEKSQIRAPGRTQPVLPLRPGIPERRTHDYGRFG